jgi:hypothetical protein
MGCERLVKTLFELSIVLDSEKFEKLFERAACHVVSPDEDGDEYVDESIAAKGITIIYRDSQYKKRIKLVIDQDVLMAGEKLGSEKLIHKLEKRIANYFSEKYMLDDFALTGMTLTEDIDVGSHDNVAAYLRALRRIGKVKGFSPIKYEALDGVQSFCLEGNSNGMAFLIYDLEALIGRQRGGGSSNPEPAHEQSKGILRAEVRLQKAKAVRIYSDRIYASEQIAALASMKKDVFLDTFMRVVPFGNFYKKGTAVEIVRKEIQDHALRRRMLRLLALIPEKKSLHLAHKEMQYRNVDKLMTAFAKINLSPVTLSKRHLVKSLHNLYTYL